MDEQLDFVKEIARRLDSAGIPYMLTGSMALAMYVTPRMTRDIDVVVELSPQDVKRFWQQFAEDCYVDEKSVIDAVSHIDMFNIIHDRWLIKVDFIVRKADAYHKTEFTRRTQIDIGGVQVFIVAPEDLILSKLLWSKDSGSAMQQDDVVQLIKAIENLDWAYMERWASALKIGEELRSVRSV